MTFRAALFDMDGTVLDSMGLWAHVDDVFFARRGMSTPEDYGRVIAGMTFHQIAEYTRKRFGLTETTDEVIAEWDEICLDSYINEVQLKPGALEYLQKLKTAGVKLAVATTLPPRHFVPALKRNGAYELFDAFATTHETGKSKQTGEVYLLAAQRLGVEPKDCVVFEDILGGLIGAHCAGMKAYCVRDEAAKGELEAARRNCDRYIESFTDLLTEEV